MIGAPPLLQRTDISVITGNVRKSTVFVLFTVVNLLLFALFLVHARTVQGRVEAQLLPSAQIVKELQLTDLCLFTEARYTRHPSMADFHSAFQDHPLSLEHFPSGSLVPAPVPMARAHE
jgi:hypothetical protein